MCPPHTALWFTGASFKVLDNNGRDRQISWDQALDSQTVSRWNSLFQKDLLTTFKIFLIHHVCVLSLGLFQAGCTQAACWRRWRLWSEWGCSPLDSRSAGNGAFPFAGPLSAKHCSGSVNGHKHIWSSHIHSTLQASTKTNTRLTHSGKKRNAGYVNANTKEGWGHLTVLV